MKQYLKIVPFIIVLAFTVLMVQQINNNGSIRDNNLLGKSDLVGHELKELSGKSLSDGSQNISISSYKGKYVVVNFFASWCLTCTEEHHLFKELIDTEDNIILLGVNWRDKSNDALNWLMNYGNPYDAVISDELGKSGITLGIRGIPETFLISPDGKIIMHYKGNIDKD
ncbi:MAG TPA: hypothetical protein DIV86_01165, partial [Alphaproteobacteria bacterium]|nr:hypothetical protein [Alphaproteobacteria bacterium]